LPATEQRVAALLFFFLSGKCFVRTQSGNMIVDLNGQEPASITSREHLSSKSEFHSENRTTRLKKYRTLGHAPQTPRRLDRAAEEGVQAPKKRGVATRAHFLMGAKLLDFRGRPTPPSHQCGITSDVTLEIAPIPMFGYCIFMTLFLKWGFRQDKILWFLKPKLCFD
jgi:hypothetical protein